MTTELALVPNEIEGEIVEYEPLSKTKAKALDKKIRAASDRVSTTTDALLELIEQAAQGDIHKALGLPSWTAWLKDAVQIQVSDRFQRKEFVKLMAGQGVSQRAIAGTLGVDQATVSRDLEGDVGASTGLDGKVYANEPVEEVEAEPIEAEVVDDDYKPSTAVELVDEFSQESANLWNAVAALQDILTEENWGKARKRCAKAELNSMQECITHAQSIVDDLMTT